MNTTGTVLVAAFDVSQPCQGGLECFQIRMAEFA
jgi:hypothetical protein